MSRTRFALVFFLSLSTAWPCAVQAQRSLAFDAHALPEAGAVAIAVAEDLPEGGSFAAIDARSGGALRRAAQAEGFRGKADSTLDLKGFGGYERLLVVGVGKQSLAPRELEDVGGRVAQAFAKSRATRVELVWDGDEADAAAHLALGASLGQYTFDKYRSKKTGDEAGDDAATGKGELVIRTRAGKAAGDAYVAQWKPVADAVALARDLATEPGNALWPEEFVARVRAAASGLPLRIEVLDVAAMRKLGMGGILAVGQGSVRPPRLLLLRYDGGRAGDAPLAFVGKGITFDSGGISIKPNTNMWQMKGDMTGAATVVSTAIALAGRKAPVNVVAVAALAENMPSGSASRPGDVVRTASGKTFEIMSTDAEGRMVLTDALWYVQREDRPKLVVDVATLTGAIVAALGGDYAGLFSRDDRLAGQLLAAGEASGEELWRMPLRDEYGKRLKSPIADLRNGGGTPGAGVGAYFIGEWVDRALPWAHLDIAGSDWKDSASPTVPEGASGFGVRLLDRFVRDHHE
ncbi:leucyl aminopeptidase [Luteimonas viscosa]|uniref:Probable cytosol aminopeptidase n=1 Tax=Luteimonas viscosa TaxID=1132694 RepID=A0A5D4XN14_9GAMM|nr:leucyl aminopeptidase [Luteimonas viscosa]TYT25201.1 leucyl aminopeptidase [Luteimonas viscosa]